MNYTAWSRHSLVSRADVDKVAALPQLHTTTTTTLYAPRGYEVQAPGALAAEAPLDVGHELAADVLEAVDAERRVPARLARDVALAGVRCGEHGEHDGVLRRHPEVRGQVRAGLAHVGGLERDALVIKQPMQWS